MGKKPIMGAAEGKESWPQRKLRERDRSARGYTQKSSPKPLAGKTREADFLEFHQQVSKPGVLAVGGLGWERGLRTLPCSWKEGRRTIRERLHDLRVA